MAGTRPILIAQLSDSHLRMDEPGRATQFAAAIDAVNALKPQPLAVLVTGDLVDNGQPDAYGEAARLLGALRAPFHVLPGNHDDRANLRAAFGLPGESDDLVRYVTEAGPVRLIVCDTLVPGEVHGQLDVAWVAGRLDEAPGTPTIVAMHHPPAKMGVPAMDGAGLPDATRNELTLVLERSPQVLRIVAGHVHRAAATQLAGRPVVTAPSVNFQLLLDFEAGGALAVSDDPPGFLIHVFVDGEIVTHVQPVPRV